MTGPLPAISQGQLGFDDIRHLIGIEARVILEIGAHHGWHTAQFIKFFPNAAIYAFEPDPRAIAKFTAGISDPRVHLFKTAIGATNGKAKFHASGGLPPGVDPALAAMVYPQGWDQSGSLHPPKAHKEIWPWCEFDSVITVDVCRLDSWARDKDLAAVDFIWADMQGAEGDLVTGGYATLARTRYLYVEYSNDEIYEGEPTLQMLLEMLPAFSVIRRFPGDVLLKNMQPSVASV